MHNSDGLSAYKEIALYMQARLGSASLGMSSGIPCMYTVEYGLRVYLFPSEDSVVCVHARVQSLESL